MSMYYKIKDAITGKPYESAPLGDDDDSLFVASGVVMTFPMKLRRTNIDEDWWTLPWEPIINLSGKNNIIKRNVAKATGFGGSIKERWAQDDWEITIEGYFMNPDTTAYPKMAVAKLKELCESDDTIEVEHEILESVGITRIVIENYDLPNSVGEEIQRYTIKALSDKYWKLLVDNNNDTTNNNKTYVS